VGTVPGLNSGRRKEFFSSPKRPDRLWDPISLLFSGYRPSSVGVKQLGREVSH
jgi:hypothetical protein